MNYSSPPLRFRIGLINIMPNPDDYAVLIRGALSGVGNLLQLREFRLSKEARTTGQARAARLSDELARCPVDAMIVSGAPVEHLPFSQVSYWEDLCQALDFAREQRVPTLGICFGGLAVARYCGLDKRLLSDKAFGVFDTRVTALGTAYTNGAPTIPLAVSSWALLDTSRPDASGMGSIDVLAYHDELGPLLLATRDKQFVMALGHPEYTRERLLFEWQRDSARGLAHAQRLTQAATEQMADRLDPGAPNLIGNWIQTLQHRRRDVAAAETCL